MGKPSLSTAEQGLTAENLTPADEPARLAAVKRYDILDTPPDGSFDRITAHAARLFNVPISIVSIVDHDRIWFKSHHGLSVTEIGRDPGLCASAILRDDPRILPDARCDLHALANPLVAGEFGLRFYAGVPLRTHDGFNLGTLCVIDKEPRQVSADEIAHLEDLASIVMDQLELRLSARAAVSKSAELTEGIEESGHDFRVLAESMSQKMFTATENGDVDYFNSVWTEFSGLSFRADQGLGLDRDYSPRRCRRKYPALEAVHRYRRTLRVRAPLPARRRGLPVASQPRKTDAGFFRGNLQMDRLEYRHS